MSAFKQLNRQDVYVTDYTSNKQWYASGSTIGEYGLEVLRGFSGSTPGYPYPSDLRNGRHQKLTYDSTFHNYYTGSLGTASVSTSGKTFSGLRYLSMRSFADSGRSSTVWEMNNVQVYDGVTSVN